MSGKQISRLRETLHMAMLLLILGVSMNTDAGWFGFGGTESWKEEVQLSDGRVIVVERETLRERGGDEWASNRSGSKPKEYRIRFSHPDGLGRVVDWRSTKKSPQTWPEIPLVFDVESGKPTVFSLLAISPGCEIYSKYVYQNGAWTEESLSEQFEKRPTNLLFGNGKNIPSLLVLEDKRNRNSGLGYRPALKHVGPNRKVCGD